MMSEELIKFDFKEWFEIKKGKYDYNRDLILNLLKEKGVYIIRSHKPIGRIKGESDIIYIGQGTIQSRLQVLFRSLLPRNYREYMAKHTAREDFERIINELNLRIEFSYLLSMNTREKESELIIEYRNDHIEPPPLNNTRR